MERFLYRLANSPFADRFILKGALLLTAWRAPFARPTMDIDLAGKTSNKLEHIQSLVGEICELSTEPDGIEFEATSIQIQRIKEDADYEGVRVRFNATLARARIPMQIDIGFGDVISPRPIEIEYPAMLEFPPPMLLAYPKESSARGSSGPMAVTARCRRLPIWKPAPDDGSWLMLVGPGW